VIVREARAVLGLADSEPLAKAELRRAYLQALKRHKPEADPEGFQLVREAYELLTSLTATATGDVQSIVISTAPASSEPSLDAGDDSSAGPLPEDESYETLEAPRPPAAHLEPYRERLRGMFGLPWSMRAEVGWEAYQAFPGDVAAREFLLELLPPEARSDIVALLLDGVRVGDQSCLYRLLHFAPEAVPVPEIERLEATGDPEKRILAARARVERGDGDLGVGAMEALLPSTPGHAPDPALVAGALDLILRLEARGEFERSALLRTSLSRYLGGPTLPAAVADTTVVALFALTGDLAKVDYLPTGVRRALARGALVGYFGDLATSVRDAERELGQASFDRKIDRLDQDAPSIAPIVRRYRALVAGSPSSGPSWLARHWWHSIWLLLMLIRLLSQNGAGCTSSEPHFSLPQSAAIVEGQGAHSQMVEVYQSQVRALCLQREEPSLCLGLPTFLESLDTSGSCALAKSQVAFYQTVARTPEGKRLTIQLATAFPLLCRP
jgi:hypothetical protein